MLRSAALIAHVQELAREFHAQAITYPIKTQLLQKRFDCSVCIVRYPRVVILHFDADAQFIFTLHCVSLIAFFVLCH